MWPGYRVQQPRRFFSARFRVLLGAEVDGAFCAQLETAGKGGSYEFGVVQLKDVAVGRRGRHFPGILRRLTTAANKKGKNFLEKVLFDKTSTHQIDELPIFQHRELFDYPCVRSSLTVSHLAECVVFLGCSDHRSITMWKQLIFYRGILNPQGQGKWNEM